MHGSTFGGGPLVCAAALEFLIIVEEDNLLANVRDARRGNSRWIGKARDAF